MYSIIKLNLYTPGHMRSHTVRAQTVSGLFQSKLTGGFAFCPLTCFQSPPGSTQRTGCKSRRQKLERQVGQVLVRHLRAHSTTHAAKHPTHSCAPHEHLVASCGMRDHTHTETSQSRPWSVLARLRLAGGTHPFAHTQGSTCLTAP